MLVKDLIALLQDLPPEAEAQIEKALFDRVEMTEDCVEFVTDCKFRIHTVVFTPFSE